MGSVTAPPCTESVRWYVLKTPVDISAKQIAAFAHLYPHDVRPVQPLKGASCKRVSNSSIEVFTRPCALIRHNLALGEP